MDGLDPNDPHFFGYGSLVNRRTHAYGAPRAARLMGWRRIWQPTRLRGLRFLSVHPVVDAQIDGLIAQVPGADWVALDLRELAYRRRPVTVQTEAEAAGSLEVEMYVADPAHLAPGEDAQPVLLSYLDTVVQGFLKEFGKAGAARFFETTDGWPAAIVDDRQAPIYPRATGLTAAELSLVDAHLDELGCKKIPPSPASANAG